MKNSEILVAKDGGSYAGVDIAADGHWCLPEVLKFQICFYYKVVGTKVHLTVVAKAPWPFGDSRTELVLDSNVEFELSFFEIVKLKIGVKNWRVEGNNIRFTKYVSLCVLNQCINQEMEMYLFPKPPQMASNEDVAFKAVVMQLLADKNAVAGKCNCH